MVTWLRQVELGPEPLSLAAFAGERGIPARDADPLIAIRRDAWERLLAHVRPSADEAGGVLVGSVWRDPASGQTLVDVVAALPALGAHGSPTYFRFTPAAWDAISCERDALHPDLLTVGWYHSHPGLGVFYSGTDRAAQRAFFGRPWNVGIVVDPAVGAFGLFLGPDSASVPRSHLAIYGPLPASTASSSSPEPARRTYVNRYPAPALSRRRAPGLDCHPAPGLDRHPVPALSRHPEPTGEGTRPPGTRGVPLDRDPAFVRMTVEAGRAPEPIEPGPPLAPMPPRAVDEAGPPALWRNPAAWAVVVLLAVVAIVAGIARRRARRQGRRR